MFPVTVPTVQEYELGVEAVNAILGLAPLHIVAEFAVVTVGIGFTVTARELLVKGVAKQSAVTTTLTVCPS
jgi:hypothetical protein